MIINHLNLCTQASVVGLQSQCWVFINPNVDAMQKIYSIIYLFLLKLLFCVLLRAACDAVATLDQVSQYCLYFWVTGHDTAQSCRS